MDTYRIAVVVVGTDRVKSVSPGAYATEIQAKAEILHRNARFPLAARLERVVLVQEVR
jgi:hypothetical protein